MTTRIKRDGGLKINKQIDDYCVYCEMVVGMTPACMHTKRYVLYDLENYMIRQGVARLEDVSNENVDGWIMCQRRRGNTGRTINNRLANLRALVRWWHGEGLHTPNLKLGKIRNVKMEPPRREYYTEQQINMALTFADRREWLMIKLAYDCAFRMTELRTLRLSNIDGRIVRYLGKGRKERQGYMSVDARVRLDDYIQREHISNYLWPSPSDRSVPIGDCAMRKAMGEPFRAAGIESFYPHALRHSRATDLQRRGASIGEISVVLGHTFQTTTETYMHALDDKRVEEIMERHVYSHKSAAIR